MPKHLSMPSFLNELNPVQRQAVTTIDGPSLIIAGPGSGKTRVLTYRIAYLLEQGVPPGQILALTFTNKAAKEMKERIEKVVGGKAHSVWAGTFHSIFARILRMEATKIGFPANFTIYDTDDSGSLIRTILKEMNLDTSVYNPNAVRSRISSAKSNLITPKAYAQNDEWKNADRMNKRPFIFEIYEKYVARCLRAGAMDFDDLLYRLFELLKKNPDGVREKYQQRFKYVLVDEFQDTNFLQYAILKQLVDYPGSPRNVSVVGDDAQSIYAFRGATIDNILDFEKDYNSLKIFKLEQNYRSTHHIVQAANEVIVFNKKQIKKSIFTDREDRQKIKLVKCQSDDEEGRRVADLILEQKNRHHLNNSEIAILYRTNAQSRKFEEQLRRFNLPYRIYGGTSFYQRKEVKDFVAYLRLVVNASDEEAFRRVINYPTRGLGATTIEKISDLAADRNLTMWEAMLHAEVSDKAKKTLAGFRAMIDGFYKKLYSENAAKLAGEIARKSGLLENLKADNSPEGVSRLENLNAVLNAIAEFSDTALVEGLDSENDRSLAAYLQNVSLLTDADDDKNNLDTITLMSVHSAKGLEFRSVFVTGMEEKLFPSFMSMGEKDGVEEERRLFYVAITRAKELLTLSYAANRYRNGQLHTAEPSRFLEEIGSDHFDLLGGFGSGRATQPMPTMGFSKSGVTGNFANPRTRFQPMANAMTTILPENFKAAPPEAIVAGVKILHQKFGEGVVKSVDGPASEKVAAIEFQSPEVGERRIILRFSKLMLVEN